MPNFNLDTAIRKIPDFPKKGILFYDVTSILTNPDAFAYVEEEMAKRYCGRGITGIVAIESRGFVFAAPLALRLNVPLILARKKGKLPGKTISQSYQLEYGEATLELHIEDVKKGMNLLIVDDLIATGGTLKAVAGMLTQQGALVEGIFSVIGLAFLPFKEKLAEYEVTTLIDYKSEKVE